MTVNLEKISESSQILASLFRLDVSKNSELASAIRSLNEGEWPINLSDREDEAKLKVAFELLHKGLEPNQLESLHEEYNRLFVGPFTLPCPPWGSVYLDKDKVIFGTSTLDFRDWMKANGISLNLEMNEPEDHIGLMLIMISTLAGDAKEKQLSEILNNHFYPWIYNYLDCLEKSTTHDFYRGLAKLSQVTLKSW